ncbi:MAG: 3'-5' exoribonuclease [Bacteroidales bacterium]|jgi:DNA polymerase-3 subunit epsilon|nr:3'-5' exoribonuclease [Bacteroidales bacterium]
MDNFAAIDVETANCERSSICSIGLVVVKNRQIEERLYRLVRPCPNYYLLTNIHGISDTDTCCEPEFPEVWAEISCHIAGLTLVAHNSPFDESCLRAAHRIFQMPYPDYVFRCTYNGARRILGDTVPNHRLPTVAAHCGHTLVNRHHALADAEACAAIAMHIFNAPAART